MTRPKAVQAPRKPAKTTAKAKPQAASASKVTAAEGAPANALQEALAASDKALTALAAAASGAPGRYDLAVRIRLDALAHHLQQVRDFVAAHQPQ